MNTRILILMCICVLSSFTGCASSLKQKTPDIQSYALEVERPDTNAPKNAKAITVKVREFFTVPRYDTNSIVYRTGEQTYIDDYYNRFDLFTPALVTIEAEKWLATSPMIKQVAYRQSYLDADYFLEAEIQGFYGDFRDSASPKAFIRIQLSLLEKNGRSLDSVLNNNYSAEIALESPRVSLLIDGFNKGLADILKNFEQDLDAALK